MNHIFQCRMLIVVTVYYASAANKGNMYFGRPSGCPLTHISRDTISLNVVEEFQ